MGTVDNGVLIGIVAFITVIVTASILILRKEASRVVSSSVITAAQYEERYTRLALSHAAVSARVYELENEYKRLKLEFEAGKAEWLKREAEWSKREADWASERRYMQQSINSLALRVAVGEGVEGASLPSQDQDILARGAVVRNFLMTRFNVAELRVLVSDAGGDWGEIASAAKIDESAKTVTASLAQETVEWFSRRERLLQLEAEMRRKRPQQSVQ